MPSAVPEARPGWWTRLRRASVPYPFLLSALAGLVVWVYRPLLATFQLSFYSRDLLPTDPRVFAGWHNHYRVVTLPQA